MIRNIARTPLRLIPLLSSTTPIQGFNPHFASSSSGTTLHSLLNNPRYTFSSDKNNKNDNDKDEKDKEPKEEKGLKERFQHFI